MRTNGRGSSDVWMIVIPLCALLVFTSFAGGGPGSLLTSIDGVLRSTARSVADVIASLF